MYRGKTGSEVQCQNVAVSGLEQLYQRGGLRIKEKLCLAVRRQIKHRVSLLGTMCLPYSVSWRTLREVVESLSLEVRLEGQEVLYKN